ncbi:hypothetical protein NDU88_005535 [Pleurodeles waltl]|uniref:Uncharacterized protein n=1 Tax=Pleurodeles waltl TaxID=8319 RepID=A0AAV7UIF1_PLEWA|nr:hypothetical protein NDU88_005535 [Pleurodeles waltl]
MDGGHLHQVNKMDRYVVPLSATSMVESTALRQEENMPWEEQPFLREIMVTEKELKGTIEPKLEAVTINIALLWPDYQKLSEKVTSMESIVGGLQNAMKSMDDKVSKLENEHIQMTRGPRRTAVPQ